MFIAGLTQSLGEGIKGQTRGKIDREKMQMLREQNEMKRTQFGQQSEAHNKQMELMALNLQNMKNTMYKQNMQMLRDGSYENIDKFLTTPKEDGNLDNRYLRSTYVDNPVLNQIMANKMGMPNLTSVEFDQTSGDVVFRGGEGQSVRQPIDMFLGGIGYFNKRDELANEAAMRNMAMMKEKFGLLKTQAEIRKADAQAGKAIFDTQKIAQEVNAATSMKELNTTAEALNTADSVNPGDLYEFTNNVKGNAKLSDEIRKDKHSQEVMKLMSIQRQVSNFKNKIAKNESLNSLVNMGKQALEKYAKGTGLSDEERKMAREALKLKTEGSNIVANYIKILSGAAFGEVELAEKIKALGLDFGTGKESALASIDGLLTNMIDGNTYALDTLSHDRSSYIKGAYVPKEYKDIEIGKDYNVGGTNIKVIGYNPITGKLQFERVK